MATLKFNSKSPTIRRIMREASELSTTPSPDYTAEPLETDLFEWHFTLRGPPNSPYESGIYHGRIVLPATYPLRPPSFRFVTPSGRFEANREICLSISGHHEETWQPAWGVRTALVALRSFMETDPKGQLGGLDVPDNVRRKLALESPNFRCAACGSTNAEIMRECGERVRKHEEEAGPSGTKREEVTVPPELKMGWRDEMEKPTAATAHSSGVGETPTMATVQQIDEESAELAEGFVQTVPLPAEERGASPVAAASARPGQTVPQPARTVPLPDPQYHPAASPQGLVRRHGVSNEAVPLWIDRLIVILGVVLAVLVLKVFVGA